MSVRIFKKPGFVLKLYLRCLQALKREEVIGDWRKLHNERLLKFYHSSYKHRTI